MPLPRTVNESGLRLLDLLARIGFAEASLCIAVLFVTQLIAWAHGDNEASRWSIALYQLSSAVSFLAIVFLCVFMVARVVRAIKNPAPPRPPRRPK